jgi:DNA-damage-inducible protein D
MCFMGQHLTKGNIVMNQLTHTSPFDGIRHEDERGKEYWSAHELGKLIGYSSWHAFQNTLVKAREACSHNNQYALEHFYLQIDVKRTGNGSLRKTEAYRLSRYACYLIILNADPNKPIVAVGQTYFAYQTRHQEVVDLISLSSRVDDLKQDVLRFLLYTYDCKLQQAAQETRVVEPGDFAIFFNHGYMGLIE